jgi:hypothetical protein
VAVFPAEQLLPAERTAVLQLVLLKYVPQLAMRTFPPSLRSRSKQNSRSGPLPEREMIG